MLKTIVHFSLRFPGVVLALACLVAAYGLYITQRARLDVFPEFAPPRITIQTEAPGLSPEEVEALVTRPIENALNGSPDLEHLYSQSIQGLSVVTTVFGDRADIYRVRQLIAERLTEIGRQLPAGVDPPQMGALTASTSLILAVGLVSPERTPMELRTFADWTARLRFLGVPGVARVEVFGGEVRQLQIQALPDRLLAYGLSLRDLLEAARRSTGVRGAGFVENENQRIILRTQGQSLSPEQLAEVVLAHQAGVTIRLKDVARVVLGPEPKLGDAQIMGQPGVILLVHSQYGANTLEVTRAVEHELAQMGPLLTGSQITVYPRLFRPASFIENSIRNINLSLLIGGALVIAVLFFFLANFRSAFIAITTIPLSLLAAIIVLDWLGVSLNTITLGGFAISIGVVVDDAIIGLENVWRRWRENRAQPQPRSLFHVVLDATLEVRSPIVHATFIVAAVFWPVLMMSGVNGRLFAPLAIAFILATLASLAVAITLTPALCCLLLPRAQAKTPPYLPWLQRQHQRSLQWIARYPKTVLAAVLALCALAAAALPFFGGEFLPEFKEGHYIVRLMAAPGTSTPASLQIGTAITRELLKNPSIRSVSQQVGRAEQGEDTAGPEFSELHVDLHPLTGDAEEQVQDQIRHTLQAFPGVVSATTPFLVERIEEVLSGSLGAVVVNVFGDDLDLLDQTAAQIRQLIAQIPGARDVLVAAQSGAPEINVSLRQDRLHQLGFQPLDVLETIQTALQGTVVAQTYDNNQVMDVVVILDPARRQEPEYIGNLSVPNAAGSQLPLRELAHLNLTAGRHLVAHEGTRRRQQVTCNVEQRDLASFVAEVKSRINTRIILPPGVSLAYGGAAEAQGETTRDLLFHSLLAGVIIVILLFIVFQNTRNLLLVLANLPFALAGGVLIVFLTGASLSIGSLVGFVSLFGISMRNSILIISHYEHLVSVDRLPWGMPTAIRGATERLLPILMTALVVALGLLPIALGGETAGHEIESPMAIVILGGLLTSTALNLLVLPTLALRYGKFSPTPQPTSATP